MKKTIYLFLSIFFSSLIISKPTYANTIVKGPVFKANDIITFNQTVDGDVFLFASDVTVNATISGDLIIFAGQAKVNGTINGDLRVAAGQVDVSATVNDDATLAAGQITISPPSTIKNTLTTASGAIGFNGQVGNNTWLNAGQINVMPLASFGGDLKIYHQSKPNIDSQAKISGDLITKQIDSEDKTQGKEYIFNQSKVVKKLTAFMVVQKLIAISIEILIGALFIVLMPKLSKKLTKLSQMKPPQNIGWGFLTLITVPVASILLFISLIGIPLAVFTLLLYGFAFYLARVLAGLSLGSNLLKDKTFKKPYHSLALGLVLLSLLKLVPFIGWLAYFFFILNGLGTLAQQAKATLDKARK